MFELSVESHQVLLAILRGPVFWQTLAEVAIRAGLDLEATTDLLAALDADGWVEVRERAEGLVVALSPLGAERLGVRVIEQGAGETPRWADASQRDPLPPRAKNVCANHRSADLDFVLDPRPSPDIEAELAERSNFALDTPVPAREDRSQPLGRGSLRKRIDPNDDSTWPRPILLIGQGLTPWPGPCRDNAPARCPACGSKRLKLHAYCLCCDRWGLERLLPIVFPALRASPGYPTGSRSNTPPHADAKARPDDPARRKARLRARLTAQARAEKARRQAQRKRRLRNSGDSE
jgi:hypothetical protein